jgi:hypothetical protein
MKNIIIFLMLLSLVLGCKSKKKLSDNKPRNFDQVVFNGNATDSLLRKNWEYFSARLAVDFTSDDQDLSGNISLRMRRDSIIWFSVSASIGLQVAKGIITKDSVKILDLYEKRYFKYGISELGNMLGANVGLRELQNIILGNPVFDSMNYKHDQLSGGWFGQKAELNNVIFAKYFSSPDSSYITQEGNRRQLKANYFGQKLAGAFHVAEKMMILGMSDKKTVRMDIGFTTASDAFIPSYPFLVPEGYTLSN